MKVIEMTTNAFWKGELGVKGLVEESQEQYKVSLYVKGSQVNDYSCSCTQGNSFRGMCSHARVMFEAYQEQMRQSGLNQKPVSTSQEVRMMIREYTNREVAAIVEEAEGGTIELLPTLTQGNQGMKLEFKLGRGSFYQVKDLAQFARNVENGAYVEYGKNFGFHHGISAFSQESRPVVEFVLEQVNLYLEYYNSFQKNPYSPQPVFRELNLGKSLRDRFFSLMSDRTIEVEDFKNGKRQVLVTEGNPQLSIAVRKAGGNGLTVSFPKQWISIFGTAGFYLQDRDRIYRCSQDFKTEMQPFFEQMEQIPGRTNEVSVGEHDIPLFYERVLRKLEGIGILEAGEMDLENYRPRQLKASFHFDSVAGNEIIMCPALSYGDFSFHPVEDETVPRTVCRDVPGEFRVSQLITKYFRYKENDSRNLVIRDHEEEMYRLLTQGILEFMELGEVLTSDSFRKLKVISSPKVSFGVRMSSEGWLKLEVDAGEMSGAELSRILAEYGKKKKFYRLKSGEFLKLDDDGIMTVSKLVEQLGISMSELRSKVISLPAYRALYLDSLFKEETGIKLNRDNLFRALVRGMKSVDDSDFEIPPSMEEVLRIYQKHGFYWMRTLDHYGFGGILADDMGLGKTIQILALLVDEKRRGQNLPSLIVCPASLIYNWESEILRFAPELKPVAVTGNVREREELIAGIGEADVAVTSYDLLKRDIALYQGYRFRFQVIDEAQYIKNASTQSARAVKAVPAMRRFALTGTPIENRLGELWSIFDYLMPGLLFGYQRFKEKYETSIVKDQDQSVLKNLRCLIGPFVLRRLKTDVLKELPEKLETVVYSKLEGEQNTIYTAHAMALKEKLTGEADGADQLRILAELMKLRQLCCDPRLCFNGYGGGSAKLETCLELIQGAIEGDHKLLLFSQFTSMLELIGKRLLEAGIPYISLTGSDSKEERIRKVNRFQKGELPVFLISLKAGGTGLNLTAADVVIHYDPWWNAAAQNQATDRAHRIGQEKQVTVFKLITRHTIEENILKLQESKQSLASQVITEGSVSLASLTREDIIRMLE